MRYMELCEKHKQQEWEIAEEHWRHDDEMKLLGGLVQSAWKDEWPTTKKQGLDGIKLTKLADRDNIESFFMVFEHIMVAQKIPEEQWSLMIAALLTGKAQQASAAMNTTEAADYHIMKNAILFRYDISCDAYQQRFQQVK